MVAGIVRAVAFLSRVGEPFFGVGDFRFELCLVGWDFPGRASTLRQELIPLGWADGNS